MRLLKYILIFIIAAACIFRLWQERPSYETISGRTMGTYYGIKIKNSPAAADLAAEIEKTLTEVNAEMSVFDPDSELSKINAAPAGQWLELSEPMRKVMKKAHEIYRLSGGAFDPTVGRLIDLWGFGVKKGKKRPDDKEIRALLATSGFDKIRFDKDWQKLKKDNSEVTLNLSAIAKGYGVDRVAEKLEELGIRDYVVEIGGEVRAPAANRKTLTAGMSASSNRKDIIPKTPTSSPSKTTPSPLPATIATFITTAAGNSPIPSRPKPAIRLKTAWRPSPYFTTTA